MKKKKRFPTLNSIIRAGREGYANELMPGLSGKVNEQVLKEIRTMSISLNTF